ncbi:elongation factor G [Acetobacterium carbinolicum]|jgi:elongation factor G|uniref:elongation factor G n=1 Tax=Acetobacterium TaxID=33951 RepID=UPI000DBEBBAE|nr:MULTISPECIES: elongation factor G [unclassified Acetobacterium]AWW26467.1 elongation factor G [Acetobacterium sp. KB-1]MDK2941099.1 elongation factor [Acetobacterium sp.]MDZ5724821.1 elongation factor G [Acetobacterium sp. K1/6]
MKTYPTKNIRNILILGHGGSGKTTLTEALAFNAGAVDRMGKIDEGNTLSDFDPEEKRRKFSISSSIIPLEFGGHKINLIDVPGYFDFIGDAYAALRVADAVIIVVDALSGVQVGTEKAIELLEKANVPAFIVVNKMDRENATFAKVMDELKETFGNKIVPFELPMGEGEAMNGVVNIVDMTGSQRKENRCFDVVITDEMKAELEPYRDMIMESVAQTSEALMDKYFEGEELTRDEIHSGIRKGVIDGELMPVLCTSATLNIGVETLENMLIEYLPSPGEGKFEVGKDPRNKKEIERKCSNNEPFSALVFKTIADPYVGKLSIFKVMSGILDHSVEIYNATQEIKEKANHIYVLRGNKQIEVEKLEAGDIGAFSKLSDTVTGDTLTSVKSPIVYDKIELPKPIIAMAIEPKTKADIDKLATGLHRLVEEDPTMTVSRNKETKQTLVSGLGEMHLEIISQKLKQKFGVDVNLVDMKVPYRETIKKKATAEGKHKKQSGGSGQFGHVWIDFEPGSDPNAPFQFVDKVVGGAVPRNFIPAVEKGLELCMIEGVLAGYPVTGVKATLYDGSYHAVDSDEMSFKMAATAAYRKGMKDAAPVILEPIYHVDITVPEEYMGDIMGDLNKKRGRIMGMDSASGGKQRIMAEAPLAEMFKYATELRSMTQARGEFSMEFVRYEEAPMIISEKVIVAAQKEKE